MKWINIIGLCLQFVAFWFAAPELLGENTLKRMEESLKKMVTKLPLFIISFIAITLGATMMAVGIKKGMNGALNKADLNNYFISIGVGFGLYLAFIILWEKKIQPYVANRVAKPLLEKLISKSESRKSALVIGAICFSIGFVLQLLVAILS